MPEAEATITHECNKGLYCSFSEGIRDLRKQMTFILLVFFTAVIALSLVLQISRLIGF